MDEPRIVTDLPEDILRDVVFPFVRDGNFRFIAGVNRLFHRLYGDQSQVTTFSSAAASDSCAEICLREAPASEDCEYPCEPVDRIAVAAARLGRLETIKWAFGKGCMLNSELFSPAAQEGHVKVLEWAESEGLQWFSSSLAHGVARRGQIRVLDFILQCGRQRELVDIVSYYAAEAGQLDVLKWLKDQGLCSFSGAGVGPISRMVAENGHLPVLQWLHDDIGCNLDEFVTDVAAQGGHIDILQWARDHNVPWSVFTCAFAAGNGHLQALQWLHENGCPWDTRTICWAREEGHEDVVEWAVANGCPLPE